MFIVERPECSKGIYIILNIYTQKAYIGLSENMGQRSIDHLKILLNTEEDQKLDNINMMQEKNKKFWSFQAGCLEPGTENGEDRNWLNMYESFFMYVVYKKGFDAYNIAKKKICIDEKKLRKKYCNINFDIKIAEIEKSLDEEINKRFGKKSLDEIVMLDLTERNVLWCEAIKKLENNCIENVDYFKLDMIQDTFWKEYRYACKILRIPRISKKFAKNNVGIEWEEKSIFDKNLNLDKMAIISKFGSHNEESPYEILLKRSMDLENNDLQCCFWALKNFNEEWVRKVADEAGCDKEEPIYALLVYTKSDGTSETKVNLDATKTREEIKKKDQEIKVANEKGLMRYYKSVNGWEEISKKHTYITVQKSGKEKTVGLMIKRFWFLKESLNSVDLFQFFNSKVQYNKNTPWEEQEAEKTLQRTTACVRLKKEIDGLVKKFPYAENGDLIDCIIAELKYPYVCELSHDKPC